MVVYLLSHETEVGSEPGVFAMQIENCGKNQRQNVVVVVDPI
jgi:hypothetical protein